MVITPDQFDAECIKSIGIQKRKGRSTNTGTKEPFHYKDVVCAFDIETTRIHSADVKLIDGRIQSDYLSFMYIWQLQIGMGITIIGRYWWEFIRLLHNIYAVLENEKLCIYVHNLSYEFSYLRSPDVLGPFIDNSTVFCIKNRRVAKFLCMDDKIEFRCSYIHSNMSLETWTEKLQVEHKKLAGDLDYRKIRYPWTEIDRETELPYCINDVQGLVECIYKELERDGDDLYSIPMTSTGYIRRMLKSALYKRRDYIEKICPHYDTYQLIREAMRGGNTHASAFCSNQILPGPIWSVDRSSSYPDVQINHKFPTREFKPPQSSSEETSWEAIRKYIERGKAILMRIAFRNIRLKDPYFPCPYIPLDKCRRCSRCVLDNGRVCSAPYLEITLTDVDLKIIEYDYEWDGKPEVLDWQYSTYGELPQEVKEIIIKLYKDKTELKGIAGSEILYEKSKNLLNSVFGCSCQDPIRLTISYNGERFIDGAKFDNIFHELPDPEEAMNLQEYEDLKAKRKGLLEIYEPLLLDASSPVMPYQWGCWTTAWGRYELQLLIWESHEQKDMGSLPSHGFIYCDTDSIYYWGNVDWTKYNTAKKKSSTKNGAYATDPKGITHYMGMVEDQKGTPYQEFKTLGAKKYAYRDKDGELHITISGVVKDEGSRELEAAGGLAAFFPGRDGDPSRGIDDEEGFIFRDAGGMDVIYLDEPIGWVELDGRKFHIGTAAILVESTYQLSLSDSYKRIVKAIGEGYKWDDIPDIFLTKGNGGGII